MAVCLAGENTGGGKDLHEALQTLGLRADDSGGETFTAADDEPTITENI